MRGPNELRITASASLPNRYGTFRMESFWYEPAAQPHLTLSMGLRENAVPIVRIQSECITGEVFGSSRCDCAGQLHEAMRRIGEIGCGLVIYLRQEGRGSGIENKLRAYRLQEQGLDTVDANLALGLPVDSRSFEPAVRYLQHLGINECELLTNNPEKVEAVLAQNIVVSRIPLIVESQRGCERYLATKRTKLGHDC